MKKFYEKSPADKRADKGVKENSAKDRKADAKGKGRKY